MTRLLGSQLKSSIAIKHTSITLPVLTVSAGLFIVWQSFIVIFCKAAKTVKDTESTQ